MGRSQVVRQRVLVPRSQVRILAPQPSPSDKVTEKPLAAVVLAAGLGTRMHSETPKHLHPLLGRRLADWVVEAARELGPDPLVVVTSPDYADAFEGVEVAVQAEPRGTGDAAAAARASLRGLRRRRARRHGRRGHDHERAARPAPGDPPLGGRSRDRPLLRARRARRVRPNRAQRRRRARGDRRGPRRERGRARAARGQLLDLRLRRRQALARARCASGPTTTRASST